MRDLLLASMAVWFAAYTSIGAGILLAVLTINSVDLVKWLLK